MGRRRREGFEAWKARRGLGGGLPLGEQRQGGERHGDTDALTRALGGVMNRGVIERRLDEGVNGGADGERRERRETFDAWKSGVVPPLREEEEGERGGRGVSGGVGLSFIGRGDFDHFGARRERQVVDDDVPSQGFRPLI